MKQAGHSFSCAYVDDPASKKKGIVLAGGYEGKKGSYRAETFFFHLKTETWTQMGNLSTARHLAGDKLLVMQVSQRTEHLFRNAKL